MIKEVAIEPEVMATWQHFRELWNDLGVSRGRLVAEYPSNWRENVIKLAISKSTTKAGRILASLKPSPGMGGAKRWIPTNRNYDKGKDWLNNAEKHVAPSNFSAIVAQQNPRAKNNVLLAGEFDREAAPWQAPNQVVIPRTAAKLAECAELLLRASNELVMVEPNFAAQKERFRESVEALIQCREVKRPWSRLELHVKFPMDEVGNPDQDELPNQLDRMERYLPPLVPAGNKLTVFFWQRQPKGKRLHPRFILTELGGLQPDHGLDEGDAEEDTTIVALMDETVWQTVREDFCGTSQTFKGDSAWRVDIVGTK